MYRYNIIPNRSSNIIYSSWLKVQRSLHKKEILLQKTLRSTYFLTFSCISKCRSFGLIKAFQSNLCKGTFEDLVKSRLLNRIVTECFEDNIENIFYCT